LQCEIWYGDGSLAYLHIEHFIFKANCLFYAPPGFTFRNRTFGAQRLFPYAALTE